jgi:hypothetical protein
MQPRMKIRRVVTGHDATGRSVCMADSRIEMSTGWLFNLWLTPPGPADNAASSDPIGSGQRVPLSAAPGGSLFRVFTVPPRGFVESLPAREIERMFALLGAPDVRRSGSRHVLMHATPTLDYIVVLSGRVTLHLDDGDVVLEPLDCVIQRGTNHAWTNESAEWAVLGIAMIGSEQVLESRR